VILSARPAQSETDLSFSTLGDLLDPALDDVLPQLPNPQRRSLEVALLRREGSARDVDHRAVSVAVLGALRALGDSSPVLVAIDDVQWCDRPSGRALEYAIRRIGAEPVSMVVAERTSSKDDAVPLGLDRAFGERLILLWIGPMSVGAIHHLVRSRLGTSLPRPTLVRLHETSGGNPFFALEIARRLVELDRIHGAGEPLPVPSALHDLVLDRLRSLSDPTRDVVLLAALASHATVDLLGRAIGDLDETLERLDDAVGAGVVEVTAGRVRFTHPLLASAAATGAPLLDRRRAHLALASATRDVEARARHLALATEGPDETVASALEDAARHARARGAAESAAELGELAIRCTPEDDLADGIARRIAAADDLLDAGDPLRAVPMLDEVLSMAPSGPARAAALWRRANLSDERNDELIVEAIEQAGDDHATLSSIHCVLALSSAVWGDMRTGREHAEIALREAELAGDADLQARSMGFVVAGLAFQGVPIGPELRERAMALDDRMARVPVYFSPGLWIGNQCMYRGDLAAARPLLDEALERCDRFGDESSRHGVLYHLAELECRAGDYGRAADYARESLARTQQSGLEQDLAVALHPVALTETYLGNAEGARAAAEEGHAIATRLEDTLSLLHHGGALGFLDLSLGNLADAERWMSPLPALAEAKGIGEPGHLAFGPDLIETLVALGELERAGERLDEFEAGARELEHPWATATGWRCRALLDAARGNLEPVAEAIDRGLAAHEEIPEPFELARMHLVAGAIWRRQKRKKAARIELGEALSTFERLRTPLWADKARAELDRIGLRPAEPGGLTPTEARIAELVAGGRTNREIADELFLSVRTVEANLTRIYRKLEVRSRTELVTALRNAPT
jgi:DNA-binding CsgD family transcriptional regulator